MKLERIKSGEYGDKGILNIIDGIKTNPRVEIENEFQIVLMKGSNDVWIGNSIYNLSDKKLIKMAKLILKVKKVKE